jgi:hypothetical protein
MYDHIKAGDLVYVKRRINVCKDKRNLVCIVLSKYKSDNFYEFNLLHKDELKLYLLNYKNDNSGNITIHLV